MSYKNDSGLASFSVLLDTHAGTMSQYKYTFGLQIPIQCPQNANILLRLQYAELPHVFTNINADNNTLNYQIGATTYNLTIPSQNYNVYTLKTWLNANLTDITANYISTTNQYVFSSDAAFSILETSTCLEILGLHRQRYNSDSNTITSDGFVNLSGLNAIYVHTNISTQNRLQYGNLGGLLDYIPVSVVYGNMILFNNTQGSFNMIHEKYINSIDISLRNSHGDPLDLSDLHFTMILQVAIVSQRSLPSNQTLTEILNNLTNSPEQNNATQITQSIQANS